MTNLTTLVWKKVAGDPVPNCELQYYQYETFTEMFSFCNALESVTINFDVWPIRS